MEIRQLKGKTRVGTIEIPTRVRKKMPRRRGEPGTRARFDSGEILDLQENWREGLGNQIWPLGKFVDAAQSAERIARNGARNYWTSYDYDWANYYDWSDLIPGVERFIEAIIGRKLQGLIEMKDLEEAEAITKRLDVVENWFQQDPVDNHVVSFDRGMHPDMARIQLAMMERFRTPLAAHQWSCKVRPLVYDMAPHALIQGLVYPSGFHAPLAALARATSPREAAVMVASTLFLRRESSIDDGPGYLAELARRLDSYDYAVRALVGGWEAWRSGEQFHVLSKGQSLADLLGARRHIRQAILMARKTSDEEFERIRENADLIRTAYRGMRRRIPDPRVLEWVTQIVIVTGAAASKRLLQIAAKGHAMIRDLTFDLPKKQLDPWQSQRVAESAEPYQELREIVKWNVFV